jgi:signal transduction histidine kinase
MGPAALPASTVEAGTSAQTLVREPGMSSPKTVERSGPPGRLPSEAMGQVREEATRLEDREGELPIEEDEPEVRRWLARELHDSVASTLTTMLIEMEQLKRRQDEKDGVRAELETFQESTRQVLNDLRRLLHNLRGEPSHVATFIEALRAMLEGFETRTGIRVHFDGDASWPSRLASRAAQNLLGIVDEALRNIRNHSAARTVDVTLSSSGALAILTITDDGVGHEAIDDRGGHGVVGMKERALLVGGNLQILSVPGQGTTVQAIFPLARLV